MAEQVRPVTPVQTFEGFSARQVKMAAEEVAAVGVMATLGLRALGLALGTRVSDVVAEISAQLRTP